MTDIFPFLAFAAADHVKLSLYFLLVFGTAKLMEEIFERLGQPGIVGQILAGVLLGPSILGWVESNEVLTALAELGVMFLLFRVGLEVKVSEMLKVGGTALLTAVLGVIVPFLAGWGLSVLWGRGTIESIFIGAAMVATSVGITAQVLAAKGLLQAEASRIILAAAVIDDVLGLLVLAVVSAMAEGNVNVGELAVTAGMAIGFTVLIAGFGTRAMSKVIPHARQRLSLAEGQFSVALCLLFGLALLATYAGVAAIIGAFLAGMALAESVEHRVHDLTNGVTELLVPFFLVGIGLHFQLSAFRDASTIVFALIILVAAVLSKLIGCGLGALGTGRANVLRIGVGMIPRGEVGMVVAQIGRSLGVVSETAYGIVVFMSVMTTIIAPPLLNITYRGLMRPDQKSEDMIRIG